MSTRIRASVLFLWTCNIMRWFSIESPVVERKYFFTRFKADNYLSLTALVAGMTINNCLKLQLPLTAVHFSRKNSTFVAERNSNLKISGGLKRPLPRAWFTASGMFCKYGSSPSPSSFTTYLAILSLVSSNLHLQKYSTNSGSLCSGDSKRPNFSVTFICCASNRVAGVTEGKLAEMALCRADSLSVPVAWRELPSPGTALINSGGMTGMSTVLWSCIP